MKNACLDSEMCVFLHGELEYTICFLAVFEVESFS